MQNFVFALDLAGIAVFAISGAMVASRKEMDLIGFGLMASLTGIGGGTLRDLLLGREVFWIADPTPLWLCLGTAFVLFFTAYVFNRRYKVVMWADALGLSAFAVMGAEIARQALVDPVICVVMGVMTAVFGGLIRDVLAQETPLILRNEVYATAAALGAAVHVILAEAGVSPDVAAGAGFAACFALRGFGIVTGWSVPCYRARPGRDY